MAESASRRITGSQILLVVASLAALPLVPDWPHRHLDDPSYWGLGAYIVALALLLARVVSLLERVVAQAHRRRKFGSHGSLSATRELGYSTPPICTTRYCLPSSM